MPPRRPPEPPPGLADHVSRRQAAQLLGYTSEFPVRSLERQGRLTPVRGAMGQAWYPRAEVLRLRPEAGSGTTAALASETAGGERPRAGAERRFAPAARCSDAELVGLLRQPVTPAGGGPARPRTPVDLVADAGIGIARATRVYRFWLTHDVHPTAELARWSTPPRSQPGGGIIPEGRAQPAPVGTDAPPTVAVDVGRAETSRERRGEARREREILIRELRDPDPAVRARAFERLRPRPSGP